MMIDYKTLEQKLGIKITKEELFLRAFTHRSYLNENKDISSKSNERLEFLGDAILQFLCSEYIFKKYPDYPEGELTNLRSNIVNTESLAYESARVGLNEFLLVSRGEQQTALESQHMLANTFESILGAIYLDNDMETCRDFLKKHLFYKVQELVEKGELKDAKSLFQEVVQEKYNVTPVYKSHSETGPDHHKTFIVGIYLGDKLAAEGEGPSKRKAQRAAAQKALDSML